MQIPQNELASVNDLFVVSASRCAMHVKLFLYEHVFLGRELFIPESCPVEVSYSKPRLPDHQCLHHRGMERSAWRGHAMCLRCVWPRLGSYPGGGPPKRSTAGIKLDSLDTPAAFDSVDLSHLRSAVKRSPGYQERGDSHTIEAKTFLDSGDKRV